jgi:formylglycine-generating enzyme required for sulfatase activity
MGTPWTYEYEYAGSNDAGDVAVYSASKTADVKSKTPNKLELYDMSGDVWEWCQDIASDSFRGDPRL